MQGILLVGIKTDIAADTEYQMLLLATLREYSLQGRAIAAVLQIKGQPHLQDQQIGEAIKALNKLMPLMNHV